MLKEKNMNKSLKKLTVLTTTVLLGGSFVVSQVKPVNAGFFDFLKGDEAAKQTEEEHTQEEHEEYRQQYRGSMNGQMDGNRRGIKMQGEGEMESKVNPGTFGRQMFNESQEKRQEMREGMRGNMRDMRDERVHSILGKQIKEQCSNITNPQEKKACVQKVVANNFDTVVQRSIARVERVEKFVEKSKTLDVITKRQVLAKLNNVKTELQGLANRVKAGEVAPQEAARELREINQEVREVMHDLRGVIGKRVYGKLQRVVEVMQRVLLKIKDKLSPAQLQQAEQIISQLQTIVATQQPTDATAIRQEVATVRSLIQQFRAIVRSLRQSNTQE